MNYPKDTLTKNNEARVLEEKGEYVKYTYIDPKTGRLVKKGKYSLILKTKDSKKHLFIIPLKNGKSMIVKEGKEPRELPIMDKGKKAVF